MAKIFLYSVTLAIALGAISLSTGCLSTAPDGKGSTDHTGAERDTGEMLKVGEMAPDFRVRDEQGREQSLAEYRGRQNVVLIFYPANETPGCTAQLCSARDDWKRYQELNVQVFGVNPGSADSHAKFSARHNFPFPLLADTEGELVRQYGSRGLMGVVKRTVYGIDKEGRIVFAQRGMPSTTEILAAFATPGA